MAPSHQFQAHLMILAAGAASAGEEKEWFCSHNMPWEKCKEYLPAERVAFDNFMFALTKAGTPRPGNLNGRGIVMSGGQGHVLQALANLDVMRRVHGSTLPVEFWHAYELEDAHCEALAAAGAYCRTLQVPGVYPLWQTTMPAMLSSSFQEVLWIDTDITLLVKPERLFETEAYQREGALFWPDLWGSTCHDFGQTSWPNHIVWHLMDMPYNASDVNCAHEHEAGHVLVNKERHWKPLVLANYLATRDFFAQVLYGYKDVYRLAWLKLNASGWMSPVRPGLVGGFVRDGRFVQGGMIHFWPAGEEQEALGSTGFPRPLYIHQKKKPGILWQEVATFSEPLGQCTKYRLGPFWPDEINAEIWRVADAWTELAEAMNIAEQVWNRRYWFVLENLTADPRLSEKEIARLHPKGNQETTKKFKLTTKACRCMYGNNRWFGLISGLEGRQLAEQHLKCDEVLNPVTDYEECTIGFVAAAIGCSQLFLRDGNIASARGAVDVVRKLLPSVNKCVDHSFWPLSLDDLNLFLSNASQGDTGMETQEAATETIQALHWYPEFNIRFDVLERFPREVRRCVPFRDPTCWQNIRQTGDIDAGQVAPHTACMYCCDPGLKKEAWHELCFDEVFTEERCCHTDIE